MAVRRAMLTRLKYVSRRAESLDRAAIDALVAAAASANASRGITGALMIVGPICFQVLEGPDSEVETLFAKISSDRRHTDVVCLVRESGVEMRLFPQWAMRRIVLAETASSAQMQRIVHLLTTTKGAERDALALELVKLMQACVRQAA